MENMTIEKTKETVIDMYKDAPFPRDVEGDSSCFRVMNTTFGDILVEKIHNGFEIEIRDDGCCHSDNHYLKVGSDFDLFSFITKFVSIDIANLKAYHEIREIEASMLKAAN